MSEEELVRCNCRGKINRLEEKISDLEDRISYLEEKLENKKDMFCAQPASNRPLSEQ